VSSLYATVLQFLSSVCFFNCQLLSVILLVIKTLDYAYIILIDSLYHKHNEHI